MAYSTIKNGGVGFAPDHKVFLCDATTDLSDITSDETLAVGSIAIIKGGNNAVTFQMFVGGIDWDAVSNVSIAF